MGALTPVSTAAKTASRVRSGSAGSSDKVIEGGWGLGGNVLTARMLGRS